jgi:hypothetical protein
MGAWATLQGGRSEVHLIPAQVGCLASPQAVPIRHQDHRGVAVSPTCRASRWNVFGGVADSRCFLGPLSGTWDPFQHELAYPTSKYRVSSRRRCLCLHQGGSTNWVIYVLYKSTLEVPFRGGACKSGFIA